MHVKNIDNLIFLFTLSICLLSIKFIVSHLLKRVDEIFPPSPSTPDPDALAPLTVFLTGKLKSLSTDLQSQLGGVRGGAIIYPELLIHTQIETK